VGYAYLMEAFTTFYGPDAAEKRLFVDKIAGELAPIYWATILFNVLTPQLMWSRRVRQRNSRRSRQPRAVIVGMWCERYVIVVMSLRRTHLPSAWGGYTPTIWDWLAFRHSRSFHRRPSDRHSPIAGGFDVRTARSDPSQREARPMNPEAETLMAPNGLAATFLSEEASLARSHA
jgi:hypothetical protein